MPDTIVPVVRRPVRRTSTTTTESKVDLTNGIRKLSIGGDSRVSPEHSSPRPRRTWTPQKEKDVVKPEKKEEVLPPPINPTYEVPSATSGFPPVDKKNLPRLPVAKDRVLKTQVSLCLLILILWFQAEMKKCQCCSNRYREFNREESGPLS